jgi:ankyrin repeat protein
MLIFITVRNLPFDYLVAEFIWDVADYDHRSSLHLAAANGHLECVKFLIDSGAPLHTQDRYGKRPLEDSVHFNYPHIAQLIEEAETVEVLSLYLFQLFPI